MTVAKLEQCLDRLADIMDGRRWSPSACYRLWERLEREIALRQKPDDKLAAARDRARRLKGQRARAILLSSVDASTSLPPSPYASRSRDMAEDDLPHLVADARLLHPVLESMPQANRAV